MNWLMDPVNFFLLAGMALIAVELVIMQLTVFWLLFIGLGALIAALGLWLFPSLGWYGGMTLFAVSSAAVTAILHRPLRKWQNKPGPMPGNDAIGQIVEVIEEIEPGKSGKVSWSGAEWGAELTADTDASLAVGSRAQIVDMQGITLFVK